MKSEDEEIKGEFMKNQETEQEKLIYQLEKHRDSLEYALDERDKHWAWRFYLGLQQFIEGAGEDIWKWKWVIILIVIGFWHLLVAKEQLVIEILQLQVMQGIKPDSSVGVREDRVDTKNVESLRDYSRIAHR